MTTPVVRRGPGGHFLSSGNPGGRTSALTEVRELLRPNAKLYVDRLNELVRHQDPTVALAALREALDRLLGKPLASIEQDVRTLDIGQLFLAAAQSRAAPQTINGEATTALPSIEAAPQTINGEATTALPSIEADSDGPHEW